MELKCEYTLLLTKYYYIRSSYQQIINISDQLCHTEDCPIPTLPA